MKSFRHKIKRRKEKRPRNRTASAFQDKQNPIRVAKI